MNPDSKQLADALLMQEPLGQRADLKHYRQILIWPDPELSRTAVPASEDELAELVKLPNLAALRQLADELISTVQIVGGNGLAAPQIGEPVRVFVLKVSKAGPQLEGLTPQNAAGSTEIITLINPELLFASEETQPSKEGCLSFPSMFEMTTRPKSVRVKAFGYDGLPFEIGGDGLLAVALCHELDHLDGITIADKLSPLKRELSLKKMRKLQRRCFRYKTKAELMEKLQ